ncbi:MAG TPA: sialate O-acetylesterase [Chitinophagaceae bacterium]|nr:sialate O-acetylesterase [Chitinophagaceae bacterium]
MKKTLALLLLCGCLFTSMTGHSQVKLPRLISDSMILQRDIKLNIWGWAAAQEKVSIGFQNKKYTAITDNNGKWLVQLPAMKAGGPYTMTIDASNHIEIKDILIGDVWVCSGQSNMELSMERVKDKYPAELKEVNPFIRQFTVTTRHEFQTPLGDFASGNWMTVAPKNIYTFTAVGYFFAKSLYEKYKIPIGLIRSAVGGSPAEAWMSEDALLQFPNWHAVAMKYKNPQFPDSIRKADAANNNIWYANAWNNDAGSQEAVKWYDINYDASNWRTMKVPGYWDDQELKGVNGVVWYRKEIVLPASKIGKSAKLLLGNVIDRDSVYINGVFVGTTGYQYPPRKYDLPQNALKEGRNIIVVRIINSAGKGGFYPDKPYKLVIGSDSIDISGEWNYKLGMTARPIPPTVTFHYQPMTLYNGMIAPLLNYRIKGVIWYQGEANAGRSKEYYTLFPAMINNWRAKWKQGDFPFLYAQLANYMRTRDQPSESGWADLRFAQFKTLSVPNTGMAVITDIGEWNDIHPLNKLDVGKRLALAARHVAYKDKKVVYSGPLYQSMKKEGNRIVISFTNTGSGLITNDGKPLRYFSISGADGKFVWADAKIQGNTVIVWNDNISDPVAVRYAWADNPDGANLFNKEGLPASSFKTD